MGKNNWNRPAPVMEKPNPEASPVEGQTVEDLRAETHRQLVEKGWCLWECSALGGDVIVAVIDETITGYPVGLTVYTVRELSYLPALDDRTLQLVHQAKKEHGVMVESVYSGETKTHGNRKQ